MEERVDTRNHILQSLSVSPIELKYYKPFGTAIDSVIPVYDTARAAHTWRESGCVTISS